MTPVVVTLRPPSLAGQGGSALSLLGTPDRGASEGGRTWTGIYLREKRGTCLTTAPWEGAEGELGSGARHSPSLTAPHGHGEPPEADWFILG